MHSCNYIPVCKSIRIHSKLLSNLKRSHLKQLYIQKMDLICVSSKCNSTYEFGVWIRNSGIICEKKRNVIFKGFRLNGQTSCKSSVFLCQNMQFASVSFSTKSHLSMELFKAFSKRSDVHHIVNRSDTFAICTVE